MSRRQLTPDDRRRGLILGGLLLLIYLGCALVEPCDGHSCDPEVTATR